MKCSICKKEIKKEYSSITGKMYWDRGHSAEPLSYGRCCEECNSEKVIPARLAKFMEMEKKGY